MKEDIGKKAMKVRIEAAKKERTQGNDVLDHLSKTNALRKREGWSNTGRKDHEEREKTSIHGKRRRI